MAHDPGQHHDAGGPEHRRHRRDASTGLDFATPMRRHRGSDHRWDGDRQARGLGEAGRAHQRAQHDVLPERSAPAGQPRGQSEGGDREDGGAHVVVGAGRDQADRGQADRSQTGERTGERAAGKGARRRPSIFRAPG